VVQQILAFSRPAPYACVEVRAGQVVHEVMQLVRPTLPRAIELLVCGIAETSTILADTTQLEQVMECRVILWRQSAGTRLQEIRIGGFGWIDF
jgi:hypothetical protein